MAELGNAHISDDLYVGGTLFGVLDPGTTWGIGPAKIKGTITATGGLCVGDTTTTFPAPLATVMLARPNELNISAQKAGALAKPVVMVAGSKGIPNPTDVLIGAPYPAGFTCITGFAPFIVVCGSSMQFSTVNYNLLATAREEIGGSIDIGPKHYAGVQCEVGAIENINFQHESAPMVNSTIMIAVDFITKPGYSLNATAVIAAKALALAASKKSFDIPHPTKDDHRLRYVCLEGPDADVFCRGNLKDSNIIELPDYWEKLVDVETIGVSLTPIGCHQELFVEKIESETRIIVKNKSNLPINCSYIVYGQRKDVSKNITEYKGLTEYDYPGDNDEYIINY